MMFPEILGLTSTGKLVRTPGSPLYAAWQHYAGFAFDHGIRPLVAVPEIDLQPDGDSMRLVLIGATIRSIIWSLPQLLGALFGGLLTRSIAVRRGQDIKSGQERAEPAWA
jgi:hypothetical protein